MNGDSSVLDACPVHSGPRPRSGARNGTGKAFEFVLFACLLCFFICSTARATVMVNPHTPEWADMTHNDSPHSIYVYVWPQSVVPGDTLDIFISSISPTVEVRFMKAGAADTYVYDQTGSHHTNVPAGVQLVPSGGGTNDGLWSTGCGWQPNLRIEVPQTWDSAPYYVEVWPENGEPGANRQYALFVVRAPSPGSKVCMVLSSSTWWAYEWWGGKSLYDTQDWDRTNVASMQRPCVANSGKGVFVFYDLPWVRFLDESGVDVDYITMEDIEAGGLNLIAAYNELVFVGHSEYWSEAQRDAVEAFIAGGGNVFFASGNMCFWRTEYSTDMKQLICYKGDNITDADGGSRGIQEGEQHSYQPTGPHPLHPGTYLWREAPADRPSYSLTGAEFGQAILGAEDIDGEGTPGDWTVREASHWAFEGTGLANGDKLDAHYLGKDEVDGLPISWQGDPYGADGVPIIQQEAYDQGLPQSFHILATCEANDWNFSHYESPKWGIMGYYQRPGEGYVLTFAQRKAGCELDSPIYGANMNYQRIVLNVIRHLDHTVASGIKTAGRARNVKLFPNPLPAGSGRPASFSFYLDRPSAVSIEIFDASGRRVRRLVCNEWFLQGGQTIPWDARNDAGKMVPSGVYFYRFETGFYTEAGKIAVVR
jgi:hypothetical protein